MSISSAVSEQKHDAAIQGNTNAGSAGNTVSTIDINPSAAAINCDSGSNDNNIAAANAWARLTEESLDKKKNRDDSNDDKNEEEVELDVFDVCASLMSEDPAYRVFVRTSGALLACVEYTQLALDSEDPPFLGKCLRFLAAAVAGERSSKMILLEKGFLASLKEALSGELKERCFINPNCQHIQAVD
jgi:hypothetical protein